MGALIQSNLPAVVAALSALVVTGGLVVGIVIKVLGLYRWLMQQFEEVKGSLFALQSGMSERFEAHEKDERKWQGELSVKMDDMRERMARMEVKMEAADEERRRRSAREQGGA